MNTWSVGIVILYSLVPFYDTAEDKCVLQKARTSQLLKELCDLEQRHAPTKQCTCKESNPIAFQAEASKSKSNLNKNDIVIFDKMKLNVGDAYNPTTGIFTAPDVGVYSFTWTVMSKPGSVFHTEFTVDGKVKMRGYLDLQASNNYFSSTKNILVKMKKGSKAWVQVHDNKNLYLSGGYNGFSNFNGYKL